MVRKSPHPGKILKEHLEQLGLTVTKAAQDIGVARQTLNNVLNGKSSVTPDMAVRLSRMLHLNPERVQQWQRDFEISQAMSNRTRVGRGRGDSIQIRSADLVAWSERIDARYTLPILIRMLIRKTADPATTVTFPAMEDVQESGWDGRVENPRQHSFVPTGRSAWELSTARNPLQKAERDYQKRTQNPLDINPKETTLVLFTLRKSAQKYQWASAKTQEGVWKKVVVYDATDLEQWLELCPDIAIWLGIQIGHCPPGLHPLESFWDEFRASTTPKMNAALLVAGRNSEAEKVADWLISGTGVFRVLADSADEALAFAAAAAETRLQTHPQDPLRTMIICYDEEQLRQLMLRQGRLTLAWRLEDASILGAVIERGHRVLVPLGRNASSDRADLELPRASRGEFIAAIKAALTADGKSALPNEEDKKREHHAEDDARERERKSGSSLTVYRRLYAAGGVSRLPPWASPEHAGVLIPILLAGAWSESNESDRAAVSELAGGIEYAHIARFLAKFKNEPDSPVRRIGDTWMLSAPLDAWSALARYVTDVDLERYCQVVLTVLAESDPALKLNPEDRWLAALHNAQFKHSHDLRRGLVENLVLINVVGDPARLQANRSGADVSRYLVHKLIGGNPSSERWASVAVLLPLLAEAAPDTFLRAVEDSLSSDPPPVMFLFTPEKRPLGGGERHPHLLWALEVLAWDPSYLSLAARTLAKLARLDPGGELRNRPLNSLREIFCCWHPNTAASVDDRIRTIDMLWEREPSETWRLLLELLPKDHDVGGMSAEPRWREKPECKPVTYGEIWHAYEEIVRRTLDSARTNKARLLQLVDPSVAWPSERRRTLVQYLKEFSNTCESKDRADLWEKLREFVSRHRTFRSAGWALPESELMPFEDLLKTLEPQDLLEQHSWLFDEYLPDLRTAKASATEIPEREAEVAEARRDAASTIMRREGFDALFKLAQRVKMPWLVGALVADLVDDPKLDQKILEQSLSTQDPKSRNLGLAFVLRRCETRGAAWSENILQSNWFKDWTPPMKAYFCLGLTEGQPTWSTVAGLGSAVEEQYWANVQVYLVRLKKEEHGSAIEHLLKVGRSIDALEQGGSHPEYLSTDLLVKVLESAIEPLSKAADRHGGGMLEYYVGRMFDKLRLNGELSTADLGRLELQYLPLLERQPLTLHKLLQTDPEFFADLVAHAFKGEDDDSEVSSDAENDEMDNITRNRARVAWDLLSKWHDVPGLRDDKTLDSDRLKDWVNRARAACAVKRRAAIGDERIGEILASAPGDADGVWPHQGVRDIIEATESPNLDSGIHAGRFNQRGTWTKSPLEGGRQERELAKRYRLWAGALIARWPRTARILSSLGETYERMGKFEDVSAERLDTL